MLHVSSCTSTPAALTGAGEGSLRSSEVGRTPSGPRAIDAAGLLAREKHDVPDSFRVAGQFQCRAPPRRPASILRAAASWRLL